MSDLKPCPFCGSINISKDDAGFGLFYIYCNDCDTRGPVGYGNYPVSEWNTRAESEKLVDLRSEVAELRAINAKLVEALEGLCSWESPLTQDKWDIAREAIAEAKAEVQG